jgi:NAD(P)-dependent dehydrogenase (short-subunit alcohol dehydrogenase family)
LRAASPPDFGAVERMVAAAVALLGAVDVVVNNAGGPWMP